MSVCGSPDSQRSSFSSAYTCSGSIPSPDTAATTPNSSCSASPKTGNQYVEYSSPFQLPSSPDLDLSYGYDYSYDYGYGYTYPASSLIAPPPPAEYPFAYQYPELTSPPPPPPPPPASYHQPQQPLGYELSSQDHTYAPTPEPPRPKYSGYPPASAFYGPQPPSPSRRYRSRGSRPSPAVDPERYRVEKWVTADGRKVEYSAMHLHCATM